MGNKERACLFAKWLGVRGWVYTGFGVWEKGKEKMHTEQLYGSFITEYELE